jgi:hypothetical protein
MLKNASEKILVPKNIIFLKILNFVQSFVECKVSLADGTYFSWFMSHQQLLNYCFYIAERSINV